MNEPNVKNILYSAQKSSQNKFGHKNFSSNLNQKYPSFPKKKQNNPKKSKIKSSINDMGMNLDVNNIKNIQNNYNDITDNNHFIINSKNNRKIIYINSGMNDFNKSKTNNYINMNLKPKQNMYHENKKFVRNLSGENNNINIGYTTNNDNQRSSVKKESSYINKILYIKNNNLFQNENGDYINNRFKYNENISKEKEKIKKKYKEILSKSSFNDIVNHNDNSINKQLNREGNIKYIIPNKTKLKNNNNNINNSNNIKIDNLKKYLKKTEKLLQKKSTNKNELQLNNNNNFLVKSKTNSTPIGDINFIFTNPNQQIQGKNMNNKNYIVRNSVINDELENNKKLNSNNNYIVNVNKYINIINKKNKIINKSNNNNNNNGINIYNYNSYKIINSNLNNTNKKQKKNNNTNKNNYIESPEDFFTKKYKSINKNTYIPNTNSNYKDQYNPQKTNFENILKNNNFRINTNTSTNPNQNGSNTENILSFKKLKTINYINKNIEKNDDLYENKLSNTNLKNHRQRRFESELKNSNIDSSSFNYFNKNNNTNSSLLKGINGSSYNNNKNNKYANSRIYSESFSSSTKNLNSSQRNTYNYNPYINNKINISMNNNYSIANNNLDRNTNIKKGRNEKYNIGIIFKPQTIGQKLEMKSNNLLNSNRNSKLKNIESKNNNLGTNNNINNKNLNFIKLMKTVNDYKNKSNNKQRYENYINIDKTEKNMNKKKQIKFSYNPEFSNLNQKNFSDKKVIQNINQNSLTMYSIYIISHYFTDFNKIGLSKVVILDKNNKMIPVICSNNNCGKDSNQIFNGQNNNNKKPFITEFKKNIYINFYINNAHSKEIKSIQITNYLDIKRRISPVGKIEIYKGKILIFKGILNSNKISNIAIVNKQNNYNNQEMQDLNDINEIMEIDNENNNYLSNNRHYSMSRYRSIEEDNNNLTKNKYEITNEYDNYYTSRIPTGKNYNNLIKNYSNDKFTHNNNNLLENENENENEDNIDMTDLDYNNDNSNDNNISSNNLKNNIKLNLDKILTQKLSWEFTKSNKLNKIIQSSHKNTNENFETYNSNNSKNNSINKFTNSNSNKNINRIEKTNATLNNKKDTHNTFFNLFRKTYNKNEISDINQIFKTSLNKLKDYSSFNIKNKLDNNNTNTEMVEYNMDNIENDSFNDLNFNNMNNNNNIYNNMESPNYIEFNKIRFVLSSNYGHPKYVGLTGIELFNVKSEQINIESALTIGALPKDLRTLYNDEKEQRIFENVFNKINNTNDCENMWVTRFKKNYNFPFVELYFKDKLRISKIKIYNYNEKDKLNIGAKTIELYLDDEFYNTIHLKQGTGEIAFDFVKQENKNKDRNNIYSIDESEIIDNEDFGQEIFFPIKELKNEKDINNNSINTHIKYASILYKQCYETPYLPSGYCLKLVLISNYYKGISPIEELDLLKYTDIGFNAIELYDDEGKNILKNERYKIISNSEIFHNDDQNENKEKIIINGAQNENMNNCVFFLFDIPKKISKIKFFPLEENNKPILNTVKEIKIFCDCNIIFEGDLYKEKPTVILFTSEKKILGNIDENYLTNEINERKYKEEKNDKYISLILN